MTMFHCVIPVQGSEDKHIIRQVLKGLFVQLFNIPRTRISGPRRSPVTTVSHTVILASAHDAREPQDLLDQILCSLGYWCTTLMTLVTTSYSVFGFLLFPPVFV